VYSSSDESHNLIAWDGLDTRSMNLCNKYDHDKVLASRTCANHYT
jgi:hypothetical protein